MADMTGVQQSQPNQYIGAWLYNFDRVDKTLPADPSSPDKDMSSPEPGEPSSPDKDMSSPEPVDLSDLRTIRYYQPRFRQTCEEMCKILIETYNTSIIDYFSKDLQIACTEESLRTCTSTRYMRGNKRHVLARLISNKTNAQKPSRIDFVGGPFNLTYHWSSKYKKAVYIWGERHSAKIDYPKIGDLHNVSIEKLLLDHFPNSIAFSDFYLEMQAFKIPGHPEHDYSNYRLSILRNLFSKCVGPSRIYNQYCDTARMHFFDIRQGDVNGGTNSGSLFQTAILNFVPDVKLKLKEYKRGRSHFSLTRFDDIKILTNIIRFVERWRSFLDFLALFDDNKNTKLNYKKFWYDQLRNFHLLSKEISVMHTAIKPLLNIFIQEELDVLLSMVDYKQLAEHSKNVLSMGDRINNYIMHLTTDEYGVIAPPLSCEDIEKLIRSINIIFIKGFIFFNALISDAYLLARIFKTFKINNKDNPYKRPTDEPAEPHNIIIYAGNLHSQRYRKFLKHLGFRVLEEAGDLERPTPPFKNCVDIFHISQPFFSKCPYETEDHPLDIEFFGNERSYSSYLSFNKVFTFNATDITLFTQPVVPIDLLPQSPPRSRSRSRSRSPSPSHPSRDRDRSRSPSRHSTHVSYRSRSLSPPGRSTPFLPKRTIS